MQDFLLWKYTARVSVTAYQWQVLSLWPDTEGLYLPPAVFPLSQSPWYWFCHLVGKCSFALACSFHLHPACLELQAPSVAAGQVCWLKTQWSSWLRGSSVLALELLFIQPRWFCCLVPLSSLWTSSFALFLFFRIPAMVETELEAEQLSLILYFPMLHHFQSCIQTSLWMSCWQHCSRGVLTKLICITATWTCCKSHLSWAFLVLVPWSSSLSEHKIFIFPKS